MGKLLMFPSKVERLPEPEVTVRHIEVVTIKDMKQTVRWTALASGLFGAGIAFLLEGLL